MRISVKCNKRGQNVLLSGALHGGEDELHQGAVLQHFRESFPAFVRAVIGCGGVQDGAVPVQVQVGPGTQIGQNDGGHPRGRWNRRAGWHVPHVYVSIDYPGVGSEVRRCLDSSLLIGWCRRGWRRGCRGNWSGRRTGIHTGDGRHQQ